VRAFWRQHDAITGDVESCFKLAAFTWLGKVCRVSDVCASFLLWLVRPHCRTGVAQQVGHHISSLFLSTLACGAQSF